MERLGSFEKTGYHTQDTIHSNEEKGDLVMTIEFAVGDVETTGFSCYGKDRIVEVSILRMDMDHKITSKYTTLINPCRDVGPVHIHGIAASDVINAPLFEQVAGDIMDLLEGAVFVAHNASFDVRFFKSEMSRLGHELPFLPSLCTLSLSRKFDKNPPGRKLTDLCAFHGIPLIRPHDAEVDVQAVADLFFHCLNKIEDINVFFEEQNLTGKNITNCALPKLRKSGISVTRKKTQASKVQELPYLARLVSSLPAGPAVSDDMDKYLCLLDRVLEDRCLTSDEEAQLGRMAVELGLTGEQVVEAHHLYMKELLAVALEDGIITEMEQKDLEDVRRLLGLSLEQYNELLKSVNESQGSEKSSDTRNTNHPSELVGKTVCFTGSSNLKIDGKLIDRKFAEKISAEKGMIVQKRVTKKLDILVVTDPNSLSTKAKKARDYGTRIIAEVAFWKMFNIIVD